MSGALRAPEHIREIQIYTPGKPVELLKELGLARIVQLGSNENTLGPSPKVLAALASALPEVGFYSDAGGYLLRQALAARYRLGFEQVLLGNGSGELIDLICRAFAGPGQVVAMSGLPFVQYRLSAQLVGARSAMVPVEGATRRDDIEGFVRAAQEARVVFLANPNNPTGTYVRRDELADYFERVGDDVLTVVDQAYQEYVTEPDYPDALDYLRQGRNVIVLGTFSKAYGLAGLRVGYALGPAELLGDLERVRLPFNTTSLGQVAALAALDDPAWVAEARERNLRERAFLATGLEELGFRLTRSVANFVLAEGNTPGTEIARELERRGLQVRDFGAPALARSLRITVGTHEECQQLLSALAELGFPR